jgi:hypothetical protein
MRQTQRHQAEAARVLNCDPQRCDHAQTGEEAIGLGGRADPHSGLASACPLRMPRWSSARSEPNFTPKIDRATARGSRVSATVFAGRRKNVSYGRTSRPHSESAASYRRIRRRKSFSAPLKFFCAEVGSFGSPSSRFAHECSMRSRAASRPSPRSPACSESYRLQLLLDLALSFVTQPRAEPVFYAIYGADPSAPMLKPLPTACAIGCPK